VGGKKQSTLKGSTYPQLPTRGCTDEQLAVATVEWQGRVASWQKWNWLGFCLLAG